MSRSLSRRFGLHVPPQMCLFTPSLSQPHASGRTPSPATSWPQPNSRSHHWWEEDGGGGRGGKKPFCLWYLRPFPGSSGQGLFGHLGEVAGADKGALLDAPLRFTFHPMIITQLLLPLLHLFLPLVRWLLFSLFFFSPSLVSPFPWDNSFFQDNSYLKELKKMVQQGL